MNVCMQDRRPLEDRFWTLTDRAGDCWIWTGPRDHHGYGKWQTTGHKRSNIKVHRWSYEHFNGPIPDGLMIRHTCDHPSCVNPAHLLVGTMQDNMNDKVARNRQQQGEGIAQSVLTRSDVLEIRERYAAGGIYQRELAHEFGVTQSAISDVINRKNWGWLH